MVNRKNFSKNILLLSILYFFIFVYLFIDLFVYCDPFELVSFVNIDHPMSYY